MRKVKLLIVDDSILIRKTLRRVLSTVEGIEIVGEAANGLEALEQIEKLKPDVVTLDIEMPKMNGIEALKEIMKRFPTPVIMVSSLTTDDAKITFEALDIGAVDYFPKVYSDFVKLKESIKNELAKKIISIARKKWVFGFPFARRKIEKVEKKEEILPKEKVELKPGEKIELVVIGSSTGGPKALQEVLTKLPENFPAGIIISQHMPPTFTGPFSERLNRLSKITIKEAQTGDIIKPSHAFIAPGAKHLYLKNKGGRYEIYISEEPKNAIYKPSVDVMAESVAENYDKRPLGVMLTGMGADGRNGFVKMRDKRKAIIIAQDEATCVVYGMPRAVVEAGIADFVLPIDEIGDKITKIVKGEN